MLGTVLAVGVFLTLYYSGGYGVFPLHSEELSISEIKALYQCNVVVVVVVVVVMVTPSAGFVSAWTAMRFL